jgi:Tfp pilus assembly protein PilV
MKSSSLHAIPPRRLCLGVTDSRGYLLSEVLIAIAIFSIGFAAVGTLVLSTSANNTSAHIITQATLLAAETIEALKMESIAELAPGDYSDANNPIDAGGHNGGIFQRSWVIEDPIGYDTARRIRVTVSWNRRGAHRSVELTTITRGEGT